MWPESRWYLVASLALAVSAIGLWLPAPWSAVWGLAVTAAAVVAGGLWLGGGVVGARGGAILGMTSGAAAATPLLVEFAFAPFVRGQIVAEPMSVAPLLVASMARVAAAALAGTIGVSVLLAAVTACFPSRPAVAAGGRPSRVVWIFLGYRALWLAAAAFLGVDDLLSSVSAYPSGIAVGDRWLLVAALLGVNLYGAFVLLLVGAFGLRDLVRAPGRGSLAQTLLVGGFGFFLLSAPCTALGLAVALGPVSGIGGWGYGLPITLDDVHEMYRWSVPAVAAGLLSGMIEPGLLWLFVAGCRAAWRGVLALRGVVGDRT